MRTAMVICGLMMLSGAALAAETSTAANERAMKGAPLTASEIRALYTDRTWVWGDGSGGYFGPRKQSFEAVSTGKGFQSYGEGVWFIPADGKMCFRATWKTAGRSEKKVDCFEHRKAGSAIYQRKPDGDWYVFRGTKPGPWDEVRKLKIGNRIATQFEKRKATN